MGGSQVGVSQLEVWVSHARLAGIVDLTNPVLHVRPGFSFDAATPSTENK